jgi:hypothetical protein
LNGAEATDNSAVSSAPFSFPPSTRKEFPQMAEEFVAHYTATSPSYKIDLDGKRVFQFEKGTLRITNAQDAADIDELLSRRPDMMQLVRKIDRESAERVARAHAAQIAARAVGARGTMTSSHVRDATNQQRAAERDMMIQVAAGGNALAGAELAQAFAQDGLVVTEKNDGTVVRSTDGFKPDATALPGLKLPTKAE